MLNLGLAGMCAHHLRILLMSTRVYGDLRFMWKEENEAAEEAEILRRRTSGLARLVRILDTV